MNNNKKHIDFLLGYKPINVVFDEIITPTTTLLQYLRSLYNLKGTKEGCNIGDCGACTIVIAEIVDNKLVYKAVNSCLILLPQIHGKQIITVEHLEYNNNLHPVQKAMIELHASQCGFCTPGFIMSLFSLYKQTNKPKLEDIQETFAGNLCRCTGYHSILKAAYKAFEIKKEVDHFEQNETITISKLQSFDNSSALFSNANQKYYTPKTLSDALSFIKVNPEAIIVNGGTDEALKFSKINDSEISIIDLNSITELNNISTENNTIHIGANVNLQQLQKYIAKHYPTFANVLLYFGSKQIRNKATLAGNIAGASPIGDTLPFLMAINAKIKIQTFSGERIIPINEFIIAYHKTDLKPNELITEVIIPKPESQNIVATYKLSKRLDLDISSVSIGVKLILTENKKVKDIVVYYGGMAEKTKRANSLCNYLINKEWNEKNVISASNLIEHDFNPISDARAEATGRMVMAKNLFIKFWNEHV